MIRKFVLMFGFSLLAFPAFANGGSCPGAFSDSFVTAPACIYTPPADGPVTATAETAPVTASPTATASNGDVSVTVETPDTPPPQAAAKFCSENKLLMGNLTCTLYVGSSWEGRRSVALVDILPINPILPPFSVAELQSRCGWTTPAQVNRATERYANYGTYGSWMRDRIEANWLSGNYAEACRLYDQPDLVYSFAYWWPW